MVFLVLTSLIWSFSFGIINAKLSGLDPVMVAFIRLLLSLAVFLPFLTKAGPATALRLAAIGALQFGLMYCLYISAYRYLTGHEVALLTITTPLFMVLIDAGLRRRLLARYWLAAALAVAAALVLEIGHGLGDPQWWGVLLVQAANLCFAAGQLLYKRFAPKGGRPWRHFGWLYMGAVCVPLIFLTSRGFVEMSLPMETGVWLALLYVGLIPAGLGFFLWNRGVTRVDSGTAATMNNLKVPLGVLVAWLVFGESLSWPALSLSALLFAAALYLTRK